MNAKQYYRVLVVEDELPILDNLVEKLSSADLPLQVVGTAADGEQALGLLQSLRPDILFTDIKMPIMDGLELIEAARKLLPTLRTVIVSGYSDFEYAQRAIQHGVTDYLLKPVSQADLVIVGRKLCDSLTELQLAHERQVITAQLSGSGTSSPPSDFADRQFAMYLICLGSLYDRCYEALDRDALARYWELLDFQQLLPHTTQNERWWLLSEKLPNCRMLITTVREPQQREAIYQEMLRRMGGQASITVCGIAGAIAFSSIWQVAQQLRELVASHLVPCRSQLLMLPPERDTASFFPVQQQLFCDLLASCRLGQAQPLTEALRAFLASCCTANVTQQLLEGWLLRLVDELGATSVDGIDTETIRADLLQSVATAGDAGALYATLQALLRACVMQAYRTGDEVDELAGRVRQYIDENYLEPITIDTIASQFHFSCSYITRIFKKEYSTPPFRYLLGLRISEAKRLIAQSSSVNIVVIAQSVGYEDQHYFSRIFKNVTGLSPSEYKKQCHG